MSTHSSRFTHSTHRIPTTPASWKACVLLLCLSACTTVARASDTASAAQPVTAVQQLAKINEALQSARQASDTVAYLRAARDMDVFVNHAPLGSLQMALAYRLNGEAALEHLAVERYVQMGGADPLALTRVAALTTPSSLAMLARNRSTMDASRPAFELGDTSKIFEDIDVDPQSGTFYVTTVASGEVWAYPRQGQPLVFARSPSGWSLLALRVDVVRRRVWVTEAAIADRSWSPKSDWGRTALLEFNLDSGVLLRRMEAPVPGVLGDMALGPAGVLVIADGESGAVYVATPGVVQLSRIDRGDFISPQTPVFVNAETILIADYVRGIARMNLTTGQANWFNSRDRFDLTGIDGMTRCGNHLVVLQNGRVPVRVADFVIDAASSAVSDQTIIEQATGTLSAPTHGVIFDRRVYYIAHSGWDEADNKTATVEPHPSTTAQIRESAAEGDC